MKISDYLKYIDLLVLIKRSKYKLWQVSNIFVYFLERRSSLNILSFTLSLNNSFTEGCNVSILAYNLKNSIRYQIPICNSFRRSFYLKFRLLICFCIKNVLPYRLSVPKPCIFFQSMCIRFTSWPNIGRTRVTWCWRTNRSSSGTRSSPGSPTRA